MLSNPQIPLSEILQRKDKRIEYARQSLAYFTFIYLSHYIKADVPQFHWNIYADLQEDEVKLLLLIAFRGSGKSTIASLAYPLWCAVFQKKKFMILCSDTFPQSKQIISNLIHELEKNPMIQRDFGDLKGKDEEWTATNIVLKNMVRISARSKGQQIRGLRHMEHRPDLVILDDIENSEDVRSKEQRDKTEQWVLSDVFPSLDTNVGRIVVIGSLLHSDSTIARLRNKIIEEKNGVVKAYPLMTSQGVNLWPSEFPESKIERLKKNGLIYFKREYLLETTVSEDQLVKRVGYYETIPEIKRIAIGVDLAISKEETADYTSINACAEGSDGKIYNLKNVFNRWNFNEAMTQIAGFFDVMKGTYPEIPISVGIEDVAYQKALIEEIKRRYPSLPVRAIKQTRDKKARLEMHLPHLESDQILFKREGMENLIAQLIYFGIEPHDDCVDAAEISWRMILNRPRIQIRSLS